MHIPEPNSPPQTWGAVVAATPPIDGANADDGGAEQVIVANY